MAKTCDVAVIGLGAVGSAALYQLSKSGVRALGIDRYAPPHDLGSSHGESRITRLAIGEGLAYVPLARRSHEIWRELEATTGEHLLHQVGCLVLSRADDTSSVHGAAGFLQQTLAAARQYSIAHEVLDAPEIRRRFPHISPMDDEIAYFEPEGGYLKPELCVAANLKAANAETLTNTPVTAVTQEPGHVRIATPDGDILAERVIVAAGAFTGKLLGPPFDGLLRPTRQVMHWFALDDSYRDAWANGPAYIWSHGSSRDSAFFYGFPEVGGAGSVKTADEASNADVDPEHVDREVSEADAQRMFDAHLRFRFRGVTSQRIKSQTCIYTETPDRAFLIDAHPDADRILVASPCSGHGFKHSAAIGEALAERVLAGKTTIDLSAFALSRFA